jgi:hypothetical protein
MREVHFCLQWRDEGFLAGPAFSSFMPEEQRYIDPDTGFSLRNLQLQDTFRNVTSLSLIKADLKDYVNCPASTLLTLEYFEFPTTTPVEIHLPVGNLDVVTIRDFINARIDQSKITAVIGDDIDPVSKAFYTIQLVPTDVLVTSVTWTADTQMLTNGTDKLIVPLIDIAWIGVQLSPDYKEPLKKTRSWQTNGYSEITRKQKLSKFHLFTTSLDEAHSEHNMVKWDPGHAECIDQSIRVVLLDKYMRPLTNTAGGDAFFYFTATIEDYLPGYAQY